MADKITDQQDPESRITATARGINAVMLAQVSMLRLFAHSIERFAGNYQKALDETGRGTVRRGTVRQGTKPD